MVSERSLAEGDVRVGSRGSGGDVAVRSGETRAALLDAALDGFSRTGFAGTSIRDLARAVGIRESSVYKHFSSKQAILDALVEQADQHLAGLVARFGQVMTTGEEAAAGYAGITEDALLSIAHGLFDFVVRDPQFARLRRLLTIEQFRDDAASARYRAYFLRGPLDFQTDLFAALFTTGEFRGGLDPAQTALAFFAPIHLLVQLADGSTDPGRERELLAGHVRHFRRTHLEETS